MAKPWREVTQTGGGLVSAGGGSGVWISLEGRQHLRVCRSEITGATYAHTYWLYRVRQKNA